MNSIEIYTSDKKIKITSIDDLVFLPDKSIQVIFDNRSYMTTLYAYILYRIDMYLQANNYSTRMRTEYFNLCLANLDTLIQFEKAFLENNSTKVVIKPTTFPRLLNKLYRDSVLTECNFFRGMLSTTSYLDKDLFSREDKQLARHNYGNIISTLICSVD